MRSASALVRPWRAASSRHPDTALPTCAAISRASLSFSSKYPATSIARPREALQQNSSSPLPHSHRAQRLLVSLHIDSAFFAGYSRARFRTMGLPLLFLRLRRMAICGSRYFSLPLLFGSSLNGYAYQRIPTFAERTANIGAHDPCFCTGSRRGSGAMPKSLFQYATS
jgi:hypothetical protein